MRLDDFTEVRIAAYPLSTQTTAVSTNQAILSGLANIWTDNNAAVLETNPTDSTALGVLADDYAGAEGARVLTTRTVRAGTDGSFRLSKKYLDKKLALHVAESTYDRTEKNKLMAQLFPGPALLNGNELHERLLVVGFRRETLSESRYYIAADYEGGHDQSYRGVETYSRFPLKFGNDWPWLVIPHTQSSGTAFTPTSAAPRGMIWGVRINRNFTGQISVNFSGGGQDITATFGTSTTSWTSPFFCFTPPYDERPNNQLGSAALPVYLHPGLSYTITVSPSTSASVWYLENSGSI